ncbi:DUF1661 domain-containing protein [Porphyromonas gingivalis]|uniref:DUF1661 domain-containing protein n=1 Tax=Porphyromonas gingivalis TaxID=837 RepID=UPI0024E01C63|nr:DUF1661 domain-containing protein [Porphyromonas gingivalis]WIM92429.1 DUF1661 domain-containing protein [Porphyromonas gingivalis]
MKNSRATAKKFSRRFSRKHAPQSEHFRSVNFGEADLSEKENSVVFGGAGSYKNIMGDNCRELPPYISKNIRSEEIISLFECTHLPTNSCHPLGGVL